MKPPRPISVRLALCVLLCVWTGARGQTDGETPAGTPRGVNLAALGGWDIVVAGDAIPAETHAAGELQAFLEKATGVRLRIVTEVTRADRHVFVGSSKALGESHVAVDVSGFGPEDLRIIVRDDAIAIAGGRPRGTLYGVYTFLEDALGVRFLTADHTHVPPVGQWRVVGPVDRFFHPPLAMRWSYYGEVSRDPAFATRLRVNTVTADARLGGKTGITNINHSFYRQIPSGTYGEEHPEYYCLIDGKRLATVSNDARENEPCLSNPDVQRIVTAAVLAEIERSPQNRNISVSQNDNDRYCRCEDCAAVDEREGSPMGSLLTFVNAVADEVATKHSDVQVGTLSYWYSRQPPRAIRPRPNVQIQLCSIECCLIHSVDDADCPQNVKFCEDMRNWGSISENISIWNYNTNFSNYLLPCPNLRVIEPNVRFFVANNARGIFMQAAGNAVSAELSDLRNYIISNLIWDPARSGSRLLDEFVELHYGRAAPSIRRSIDLIHDVAVASGVHRNCFASRPEQYGLDASVATRSLALLDEALALADDDAVRGRVEKASIAAFRLAIDPVWNLEDLSAVDPELLRTMRPLVSRFLDLCERHGVDRASEHEPFSSTRSRLLRLVNDQRAAPVDAHGRPLIRKLGTFDVDMVETTPVVLGGRLYRFEYVRANYWNRDETLGGTDTSYFRFIDVESGRATPPFAKNYHLGSAFVDGDTVYVTGTNEWGGSRVEIFASRDLERWESWTALDLPGFAIFNTSMCKTDDDHVLMFEISRPVEQAGAPFTARFARSSDLKTWRLTPPECAHTKERYSAPHALRFLDGFFYDFYLHSHRGYEMRVVRSRDLIHWESSPLDPVLRASKEDRRISSRALSAEQRQRIAMAKNLNNSDIDFCEFRDHVVITYSWGNQQGVEHAAEAVYEGTLAQFLRGWFPDR